MLVDSRPHNDDNDLPGFLALTTEQLSLAEANVTLTLLGDVVLMAEMDDARRLALLYRIGQLRGYCYQQSKAVSAEERGRSN